MANHLIIPSSPRRSSPRSSPRPISPVNPEPLVTAEMQRDMDEHQGPGQQPAAQPEPMDQQETQQEPEPEPEPDIRILEVIYAPEDREVRNWRLNYSLIGLAGIPSSNRTKLNRMMEAEFYSNYSTIRN